MNKIIHMIISLLLLCSCNTSKHITTDIEQTTDITTCSKDIYTLEELQNTLSTLSVNFEQLEVEITPSADSTYSIIIKADKAELNTKVEVNTYTELTEERQDTTTVTSDAIISSIETAETQSFATPLNSTVVVLIGLIGIILLVYLKFS